MIKPKIQTLIFFHFLTYP
jgi:hypothetical protein